MVEEGYLWVGDIGDIGDDVLAKEECQDDAGDATYRTKYDGAKSFVWL